VGTIRGADVSIVPKRVEPSVRGFRRIEKRFFAMS
jgi:hypothetical protein